MSDPEAEHIVHVSSDWSVVSHPEGCDCRLGAVLAVCGGPSVVAGMYRAIPDPGPATVPGWRFERIRQDDDDDA